MADGITIDDNSLAIMGRFNQLPIKVQRKVLRPSLTAASKPFVKKARAELPTKTRKAAIGKKGVVENTGALKASIGVAHVKKKVPGQKAIQVGPRRGVSRTDSTGKVRTPAGGKKGGGYAKVVEVKGATDVRKGFLRRALDTRSTAAISAMAARMQKGMTAEITRLAKKSG